MKQFVVNPKANMTDSCLPLKKRAVACFLAVVLIMGLVPILPDAGKAYAADPEAQLIEAGINAEEGNAAIVPNEVVVVYKDDVSELDEKLSLDTDSLDVHMQRKLPNPEDVSLEALGATEQEKIANSESESETTVVTLEEGIDPREAAAQIQSAEEVAFAQPNYSYSVMSVNDPLVGRSESDAYQYYLESTKTDKAWDLAESNSVVSVAVLDTGITMDHPDLVNQIDVKHAYNAVTSEPLTENSDQNGHGTFVSGVLAAEANNGIGIAGSSYNAKLLPIKVFNDEGICTTADLLAAYSYLDELIGKGELTNLAAINLSLGYYSTEESDADKALEDAISSMRDKHQVLTVCAGGNGDAAGNAKSQTCYPADFDSAIAVTSLSREGIESAWSDRNAAKDISAPGEDILSTDNEGGYTTSSGTSMAAPQVAGALAYLRAQVQNATADELVTALRESAEPIQRMDSNNGSAGKLNTEGALAQLKGIEVDATDQSNSIEEDAIDLGDEPDAADRSLANNNTETAGSQGDQGGSQENTTDDSDDPANSWRYSNGQKILVAPEATTGEGLDQSISPLAAANGVASYATWYKSNGATSYTWKAQPTDQGTRIAIPGAKRVGIDVSSYQGNINWAKVKAEGITFAIIRCGSYSRSNRTHVIDSQFVNNVKGARAQGIDVGVYLYSYAQNVTGSNSAESEAKNVLKFLQKAGLNSTNMSLPVYYDLEDNSQVNFGSAKLGQMAKKFCDTIGAQGYNVGIYANQNWWRNYLTDPVFKNSNWSKWAARYPGGNKASDSGVANTNIWQFSDCGNVNGIGGYVDMNVAYIDSGAFRRKSVEPGEYMIASSIDRKAVLDVYGSSMNNEANIQLHKANGQLNQRFKLSYDTTSGYYTITNSYTGKVLDVKSAVAANKTNVQQYQSNGTLAQKWIIKKESNGTYKICSAVDPDFVLDVDSAKTADGTNVQVYEANGTAAQQFVFMQSMPAGAVCANTIGNGLYSIKSSLSNNTALDVSGGSGNDGANIQLYKFNNSAAQHFRFTYDTRTGYYLIVNERSGKALDLKSAKVANSSNIQQYSSNNTLAQRWIVSKESNGTYRIASALNTSYVLDLAGGKTANGTNVQLYQTNGTAAQKFAITKCAVYAQTIVPGTYTISSALSRNKMLDVSGASKKDKGNIQLYDNNNTGAQRFTLSYDKPTGYYTITNENSKKVLDVNAAKTDNGTNIQQYTSNNTLAQRWIITSAGNGTYRIASALNPSMVIDVAGAKTKNGTNIQLYTANNTNAQKFVFNKR